jgi:hypothetical protein
MVSYSRKVLHSSSPNENNGMLLEVVAHSRDIGGYFNPVG